MEAKVAVVVDAVVVVVDEATMREGAGGIPSAAVASIKGGQTDANKRQRQTIHFRLIRVDRLL